MSSGLIARNSVMRQLAAMACGRFDVGVLRQNGHMRLQEECTDTQIGKALGWLRRENACGAHVYIRPSGAHGLSLVDDLSADSLKQMRESGFGPALVVETSPDNFQAWLNHGRILDCSVSTQVAKELARRFGGDPSSADWRHFGRLAGFTNQKRERRLKNGLAPFVRLRTYNGRVYAAAGDFLEQVRSFIAQAASEREALRYSRPAFNRGSFRPLADFCADPRYGGDLHRAEMAWALHAARRGVSETQIRDEILHGRDLSKKGGPARQLAYAERTAAKAVTAVHQAH
jgi:hypothetical protein